MILHITSMVNKRSLELSDGSVTEDVARKSRKLEVSRVIINYITIFSNLTVV